MRFLRSLRNWIGRRKGYGGCMRCGDTWDRTPAHSTSFNETWGAFPLCERCWRKLTITERLPYYLVWRKENVAWVDSITSLTEIESAVRAGK